MAPIVGVLRPTNKKLFRAFHEQKAGFGNAVDFCLSGMRQFMCFSIVRVGTRYPGIEHGRFCLGAGVDSIGSLPDAAGIGALLWWARQTTERAQLIDAMPFIDRRLEHLMGLMWLQSRV
jgi:hypothetical protein